MNRQLAAQEHGHRIWLILRLFYRSLVEFRGQFDSYEEKVLHLARSTGINREVLRLRPVELAELLDFKSLEALRDGYIHELKELCHVVFRTVDQTDPLDRYVSDIFHEISILKEEHYTVKTYAPMYEQAAAKVELQYILDEAHTMFPQKLRQVRYLFGKARERMEEHLPSFSRTQIVIRSLYQHQDGFIREAYPDGLRDFYRFMYPCGPLEGFYQVGLSFYHSGFFPEALEAFLLAESEYEATLGVLKERGERRGDSPRPAQATKVAGGNGERGNGARALWAPSHDRLSSILRSLRAKIRRLSGPRRGRFSEPAPSREEAGTATAAGGAVE